MIAERRAMVSMKSGASVLRELDTLIDLIAGRLEGYTRDELLKMPATVASRIRSFVR
jgi:hypothetical protein